MKSQLTHLQKERTVTRCVSSFTFFSFFQYFLSIDSNEVCRHLQMTKKVRRQSLIVLVLFWVVPVEVWMVLGGVAFWTRRSSGKPLQVAKVFFIYGGG